MPIAYFAYTHVYVDFLLDTKSNGFCRANASRMEAKMIKTVKILSAGKIIANENGRAGSDFRECQAN